MGYFIITKSRNKDFLIKKKKGGQSERYGSTGKWRQEMKRRRVSLQRWAERILGFNSLYGSLILIVNCWLLFAFLVLVDRILKSRDRVIPVNISERKCWHFSNWLVPFICAFSGFAKNTLTGRERQKQRHAIQFDSFTCARKWLYVIWCNNLTGLIDR